MLSGRRRDLRAYLAFVGPAVIASIAYMDPGNFATNIQAGAKYGYALLWVVLIANLIAMLFQALSAKLGIVTGRNLAEMCRDQFPQAGRLGDVGGERDRRDGDRPRRVPRRRDRPVAPVPACRCSPAWSSPAIVTYAILTLERRGFRPIELIIGGLVAVIGALLPDRDVHRAGRLGRGRRSIWSCRSIADADALLLAVGIIGATVMPHAVYLHSGLTQDAHVAARRATSGASWCASPIARW